MLDYPITPIADGLFYALTLIATAALTISAAIYRQKNAKYTPLLLVNLAVALLFYILIIWQESASVSLNSHQLQLNLPFYQDSINIDAIHDEKMRIINAWADLPVLKKITLLAFNGQIIIWVNF